MFLAGVGFRELTEGITSKIKKRQSLADKEEYFRVFDEKCSAMNSLSDNVFNTWVQLEVEVEQERRKATNNLRIIK
jgi:hypothetical protein